MKEIASEYDEMKMNHYKVLQDNEKQKQQVLDLMTNQINKDVEIRDLKKERDLHVDELNRLSMDLNQQINSLEEKDGEIEKLTKRL